MSRTRFWGLCLGLALCLGLRRRFWFVESFDAHFARTIDSQIDNLGDYSRRALQSLNDNQIHIRLHFMPTTSSCEACDAFLRMSARDSITNPGLARYLGFEQHKQGRIS